MRLAESRSHAIIRRAKELIPPIMQNTIRVYGWHLAIWVVPTSGATRPW